MTSDQGQMTKRKSPEAPGFFFCNADGLPPWLATLTAASAAAAAAAVAAETATATAATAAKAALSARPRLVDVDRPTVELGAVEALDGLVAGVRVHLDEGEAARATGLTIRDDGSRLDRANLRKQIGQLIFCRRVRQIPYEYSHCLS